MGVGVQQLFVNLCFGVSLVMELTRQRSQAEVPTSRCDRRVFGLQPQLAVFRAAVDGRIYSGTVGRDIIVLNNIGKILLNHIVNR